MHKVVRSNIESAHDMPTTNFDLAPVAKTVDGLLAVPIDIQRITATLTFDGASQTGTGDATVEFIMGPANGNPVLDLRQTITGVWLDGAAIPVAKAAHHDFGGGAGAEMRIVEQVLTAGSAHTLRITYSLGPPQASGAGSYLPAMTWSSGPRLAFNFGFTDLGAGRYLEAWVPANLIYDQFELILEFNVINTAIAHTLITNGTVTNLGANHWRAEYPARFTGLSPLVELRATDTLANAAGSVTLPVSGATVGIEAWKLASGTANLATQVNNIRNFLTANENSTGPYMHGNRFVSFIHVGGMEYEGATTTATGALQHETFHSWWARGVKPASQADGWFDEAWTVYNDNGAANTLPFNFSDPPITLCNRNLWARVTAGGAYTDGYRFWRGVAALVGVPALVAAMSEFYKRRRSRPVRTTDIEEFLICRTGNSQIVDAFHRFVFGFGDSSSPDLWIRDAPLHGGPDLWAGRFWDSPDVWVRNKDDGGTTHQNPEFGQDNWFYARVRNRGPSVARHFVVTFAVKQFAGTQFMYPDDFLPCTAAVAGFDLAGGGTVVVKARWPKEAVPGAGSHACLLAAVLARSDQPLIGRRVWEHNNLAQKNLTIVDLAPNQKFRLPFVISNLGSRLPRQFQLELRRPVHLPRLQASIVGEVVPHDEGSTVDCAGTSAANVELGDATDTPFGPGPVATIPMRLGPFEQSRLHFLFTVPPEAERGESFLLDLVQQVANEGKTAGGIAIEVRVG